MAFSATPGCLFQRRLPLRDPSARVSVTLKVAVHRLAARGREPWNRLQLLTSVTSWKCKAEASRAGTTRHQRKARLTTRVIRNIKVKSPCVHCKLHFVLKFDFSMLRFFLWSRLEFAMNGSARVTRRCSSKVIFQIQFIGKTLIVSCLVIVTWKSAVLANCIHATKTPWLQFVFPPYYF